MIPATRKTPMVFPFKNSARAMMIDVTTPISAPTLIDPVKLFIKLCCSGCTGAFRSMFFPVMLGGCDGCLRPNSRPKSFSLSTKRYASKATTDAIAPIPCQAGLLRKANSPPRLSLGCYGLHAGALQSYPYFPSTGHTSDRRLVHYSLIDSRL